MKMKLNSRKKNRTVLKTIFFILVFYLFFHFFSSYLIEKFFHWKDNLNLSFKTKSELIDENKNLKKVIQENKAKNIFINYYYQRANELEKRLFYQKENNLNRKIFKVLGSLDLIYPKYLILKNYPNSNIEKNKTVYFFDNFTFGKIDSFDDKLIKVKILSDYGVKEKYSIISNGEVVYEAEGVGDSQGIIKFELPREVKINKNSIIVLTENKAIVGLFDHEVFQNQDTKRTVYFKIPFDTKKTIEVEI